MKGKLSMRLKQETNNNKIKVKRQTVAPLFPNPLKIRLLSVILPRKIGR